MLVGTHEDASIVAKEFNLYTRKFRSRVHVATAANPISKSVAVHIPATKQTTTTTHTRTWVNEEGTELINYVKKSSCLGAYITSELKDDEEIQGRIQKALAMHGCLRKHLLASKDVWYSVKKKVITGMILPIMLDGAESWVVSAMAMRELRSAFNRVIRGSCRVSLYTTRKHRITTESLQERLGVGTLEHYLDWRMLGHAGHVMRMDEHRLPKLIMQGPSVCVPWRPSIRVMMKFAVAWWRRRLLSRQASVLVSPMEPRASWRNLAAAVEKSLKRSSAVACACRCAGVAGSAKRPGSGYTGRATTAPAWRDSQEASSQASPRAPSGPWSAQRVRAADSKDSFH